MGLRMEGSTAAAALGLGAVGAGIAGGVQYFKARRSGQQLDRKALWTWVGVGAIAGAAAGLATCIEFGKDSKTLLDRLSITRRGAKAISADGIAEPVREELEKVIDKLPELSRPEELSEWPKQVPYFDKISDAARDALNEEGSSAAKWLGQQVDSLGYTYHSAYNARDHGPIALFHYLADAAGNGLTFGRGPASLAAKGF